MLISWLLVFVPVTTGLLFEVFASDRYCDPSACRMDWLVATEQLAERLVALVGSSTQPSECSRVDHCTRRVAR
jgi:hypothetical protein